MPAGAHMPVVVSLLGLYTRRALDTLTARVKTKSTNARTCAIVDKKIELQNISRFFNATILSLDDKLNEQFYVESSNI